MIFLVYKFFIFWLEAIWHEYFWADWIWYFGFDTLHENAFHD